MGLAPLTFTGISSFSSDFQTILKRAVTIASLPLQRLQTDDSNVLQKKTLLDGLSTAAAGLAASLSALGSIGSAKALSAFSSDSAVVTATNSGATAATHYTINDITSVAKTAAETSLLGYADSTTTPVSATGTVKLTVGASSYTLTLSSNNLVGLRDAINNAAAGVTASILTTGSLNYLSVTANTPGAATLALKDDPTVLNTDLLTATNQGSNAVFKLNGIPITRASNTVNDVIPGLSFTLLAATAAPVTLTLDTDRSRLAAGLEDFVARYNATTAEVNKQVGAAAGLLSGDFLVRELQNDLRTVASYSIAGGSVRNLTDLGVQFDSTGKASFNQTTFDQLSDSQLADAFTFLGSATIGFGGLAAKFTAISDPVTGLIKLQRDSYDQADQRLSQQIADLTDRINSLQQSVSARLHAADALLGQLEAQQRVLDASLKSVNLVLFGRNDKQL